MNNDFAPEPRNGAAPAGPHAGTIVWGLTAIAVGLLVLAGLWWDISFNLGYVLIALLIGSGTALVAAGILSFIRSRKAGSQDTGQDDHDGSAGGGTAQPSSQTSPQTPPEGRP
ncbi:hypothetical protein [Arthrobacter mobilis]|uniref:hypothetical protein n=1 Tax=Arthrobacter mobilis TaxID=2724944 RepID=UPI00197C32D6|nr:hypothetical protein [Arthrobacter mobilis]